MRLFRAWESFWGALGYLRRNRRQRKAVMAKRRNLRRRHRMEALEQRVVLNADAMDDSLSTGYESPIVIAGSQLTDNDTFSGTPQLSLPMTTTEGGTLTDNYDGTYTYAPPPGFSGTDSFVYSLSDDEQSSDDAAVYLNVAPNQAPSSPSRDYSTDENAPLYIGAGDGLLSLAEDSEGQAISIAAGSFTSSQGGIVTIYGDGSFDYSPPTDFDGDDSFTFELSDGIGSASYTAVIAVVNAGTGEEDPPSSNSAPELSPSVADLQLPTLPRNALEESIVGMSVWDLFGQSTNGYAYDAENASLGFAITGVDESFGSWQYDAGYGNGWQSLSAVSDTSAVLLSADGTTRLRFVPLENYVGTSTLSFRLWDGSSGGNGDTSVDASAGGGSSAFSSSSDTLSVTVSEAGAHDDVYVISVPYGDTTTTINWEQYPFDLGNDADAFGNVPTLFESNNPGNWASVESGAGYAYIVEYPIGVRARAYVVIQLQQEEPAPTTPPVAGSDSYTVYVPYDSTGTNIYWPDFAPDHGNDYDAEGEGYEVIANNNPGGYQWIDADSSASYSYTIRDGSGGETSTDVTVYVVREAEPPPPSNYAPVIYPGNADPQLAAIDEDISSSLNSGSLVSELLNYGNYTYDADGNSIGMAVTAVDDMNGSWECSTDGSNWISLSGAGDYSAVLLVADGVTRIRFQPNSDFYGIAAITYRLWDGTDGYSNGTTGVDVSSSGGQSAYSADHDTATISVNGTWDNTAPTLSPQVSAPQLSTIDEDISVWSNDGTLVSDLLTASGYAVDVDGNSLGIAVVGVDSANGYWEYSTGSYWSSLAQAGESSATLLSADSSTRIRFQPNGDFYGTATITFRLWDGTDGQTNGAAGVDVTSNGGTSAYSAEQDTATITVNDTWDEPPVNYAPTANTDYLTYVIPYGGNGGWYDLSGYIPSSGNDTDPEGDWLEIVSSSNPGNVQLWAGQTISYGYTITDHHGNTADGTVLIEIVEDTPPPSIPGGGSYTMDEDGALDFTVTNPRNESLALYVTSGPSYGSLWLDGNTVRYQPTSNYYGPDSFSFYVSDSQNNSSTESYQITIVGSDDPPSIGGDSLTTTEDTPVWFSISDLLGNDSDVDSTITFVSFTGGPSNGSLDGSGGTYVYTPDANFSGSDSFSYEIIADGVTASGTVEVSVSPVSDSPIAVDDDGGSVTEDSSIVVHPLANDWDPDGDQLAVQSASAGIGSIEVNGDNSLTYTPPDDFNGPVTITYTIIDSSGYTASATMSVTVTPVNDAPSFVIGGESVLTVTEDSGNYLGALVTNFSAGPENESNQTLSWIVTTDRPELFALQPKVDEQGRLAFRPADNANGVAQLSITLVDEAGQLYSASSATAQVMLTITSVEDAPVVGSDNYLTTPGGIVTISRDSLLANDSDADPGQNASFVSAAAYTQQGVAVLFDQNGAFQYRAPNGFVGTDRFSYTVTDGHGNQTTGEVTIRVAATTNAAPVVVSNPFRQLHFNSITQGISTASNQGTAIADFVAEYADIFSDANGTTPGVQIVTAVNTSTGTWQYSLNDGATWSTLAGGRLLGPEAGTRIRFQPSATFYGNASLTLRLWDGSNGLASGATTSAFTASGGTTAYSATGTVSLKVAMTNGAIHLNDQYEDVADAENLGTLVSSLTSAAPGGGAYGIAVTSVASLGTWQYRLSDSSPWESLGTFNWSYGATEQIQVSAPGGQFNLNIDGYGTAYINVGDMAGSLARLEAIAGPNAASIWEDPETSGVWIINFDGALANRALNWTVTPVAGGGSVSGWTIQEGADIIFPARLLKADAETRIRLVAPNNSAAEAKQALLIKWWEGTDGLANGTFTQNFTIDAALGSTYHDASLRILPTNDAPLPNPTASYTLLEDTSAVIYGYDLDYDLLSFEVTAQATNGVASAEYGRLIYRPSPNYFGTDSFQYRVFDGSAWSAVKSVTVTIVSQNDAPTFQSGESLVSVYRNSGAYSAPWALGMSRGPANEQSQTSSWTVSNNNTSLFSLQPTLAADGRLTFTPAANVTGTATVTIALVDNGGNAVGGTNTTGTRTFTIEVKPNVAPVLNPEAVADLSSIVEDFAPSSNVGTLVAALVAGAISDPNSVQVGIAVVAASSLGGAWQYDLGAGAGWQSLPTVSASSALLLYADAMTKVRFVPEANVNTSDGSAPSITFRAWDRSNENGSSLNGTLANVTATGGSTAYSDLGGTAHVEISSVNDAPVAGDDVLTTSIDLPLTIDGAVLANDVDVDGEQLFISQICSQPTHGTLTPGSGGSFTYAPEAGFIGIDSFVYEVSDGSQRSTATVWIEVGPLVVAADGEPTLVMNEDDELGLRITRDRIDGGAVTHFRFASDDGSIVLGSQPVDALTPVTLSNAQSNLSFRSNANFSGTATLTVIGGVVDASGQFIAVGTPRNFSILVNDMPEWPVVRAGSVTVNEQDGSVTVVISLSSPPTEPVSVNWSLESLSAEQPADYGWAWSNAPWTEYVTEYGFNLTTTSDVTVYYNIAYQVFGTPYADGFDVTSRYDANGDVEYGSWYVSASEPDPLWLDFQQHWTTPIEDVAAGTRSSEIGPQSEWINGSYTAVEPRTSSAFFSGTEPDPQWQNPPAGISYSWEPATRQVPVEHNGRWVADGDLAGTITFSPDDQIFEKTISVAINDDQLDEDSEQFRVVLSEAVGALIRGTSHGIVTIVDNDRTPTNDAYAVSEDETLVVTAPAGVLANDSEIVTGVFATLASGPQHGTVVLHGNGSFTYTPHTNFTGSDSFTYAVTGGVATASVTILVAPVNDAPGLSNADVLDLSSHVDAVASTEGALLAQLLDADFATDVDGALCGIAVIGADQAEGSWQYRLDESSSWLSLGSVGDSSALLLKADNATRIRFFAPAGFRTTGLSYVAWDGSIGTAGTFADASQRGGTTAFSSAIGVAEIAPLTATDDLSFSLTNSTTASVFSVLANDGAPTSATALLVAPPQHGQVVLHADGRYDFTPPEQFVGNDEFQYV
ncbi:MAG: tandem-95 repeat protein, partial [Planctomycetes bacterium]|nr:tandem-95 repeat protein [Planctomycetota bacterium]